MITLPVLLSASEPDPERKKEYWQSRNLLNVREAVRAFCGHALAHYPVVYGGHPAITPLVRQVASRIQHQAEIQVSKGEPIRKPKVLMFQSGFHVDPSTAGADVFVTPAHQADGRIAAPKGGMRNASLLRMRYEMIGMPDGPPVELLKAYQKEFGARRFTALGTYEFSAAVFIGGMEGVEREFRIFRHFHPNTPAYPVGSTGSVCINLLKQVKPYLSPKALDALRSETAYSLLMQQLLPVHGSSFDGLLGKGNWRADPTKRNPRTHIDPPQNDRPRAQLSRR
ncbi:hypothetical protein [Bradyrhizobium sp. S3.9.1]|uniref:SLOG domain-containing protein n=1 Tax=Bradyrhizobium sp. S3.9.1 TaxID=3156431 RepID=UPI0033956334